MHISDGILTETLNGTLVLGATTAMAMAGTYIAAKKMDYEKVPQAAMLSAAFFVASLVHFKLGVTSVHLVLNGLLGIILGWAAFPSFVIALFLQAIFFGHGGITVIGLNAFNFGISSLLCFYIFNKALLKAKKKNVVFMLGFLAGSLSLALAALLVSLELLLIGESFEFLAGAFLISHLPLALVEGVITGFIISFLKKVKPQLLESPV